MKITFQGNELNLVGEQVKKGEKLKSFSLSDNSLATVESKDLSGIRLFLAVPSIDTPVCDLEVVTFNEKIKEMKDVTCYTVSMDLPFAQARWCGNKNIENVKFLSDYKDRQFAEATGTYIKELGLLTRAVFILNANDELVYVDYLEEITEQPNYDEILNVLNDII